MAVRMRSIEPVLAPRKFETVSSRPRCVCHPASLRSRKDARQSAQIACAVAVVEQATISAASLQAALPEEACKEVPATDLQVQGTIPAWLSGDLYRTGPGMYAGMIHYFDGYGMLVHFQFEDGAARWSQRYIESSAYKGWRASGKPIFSEIGYKVPLWRSVAELIKAALGLGPGFTDNASVTVFPSAGSRDELVAMSETVVSNYRMSRGTLETLGRVEYDDAVKGVLTTAHPKPLGGGWALNIAHAIPGRIEVYKYRLGEGPRTLLYNVPVANTHNSLPWMHDLTVSEHHVAVVEMPAYLSLAALANAGYGEHVFLDWKPQDGTTITVLALDGSGIKRVFKLPPMFAFHFANTFEADVAGLGKCLCIDTSVGADCSHVNDLLLQNARNREGNIHDLTWKRLILPFESSGDAIIEDLITDPDEHGRYAELPCINPAYERKQHQFIWSGSCVRPSPMINRVTKFDVKNKKVAAHFHLPGGMPLSECKFVARPGAVDEDDGVVLAPFMDSEGKSMLVVLDGRNLLELARCYTPEHFVMGFHSTFLHA